MAGRECAAATKTGDRCGAYARTVSVLCFNHDPDTHEAAAAGKKLGGLRRRKEATVAGA